MFGLAASTVPYMFWFLALLAICGLLYYKMKQAASAVSHSGERNPPGRRRCGALGAAQRRTAAPLFSPLTPPPAPPFPPAEEFKSFQKLYLVVYLIMFMADWMQVSGGMIAPRGPPLAVTSRAHLRSHRSSP